MSRLTVAGLAPHAALVALWAAITHRTWWAHETYFLRDFWTNYVPTREVLKEALTRGALPLWNPWIAGGSPVVPDPNHGVFYVLAWPFLWCDDQAWALTFLTDCHTLLAALGTFVLARRWASKTGAFVAGAAFGFGGLMLSNVINVQWHFAWSWAPLWFAMACELLERPTSRAAAAVAGLWAFQLLSSEAQVVYLEGLSVLFLVGGRVWSGQLRGRHLLTTLAWFGAATAVALLIAAPQVFALFEALGESDRAELPLAEAAVWSFHLGRLWELFLPQPWGVQAPTTTFWGAHLVNGPWHGFYLYALYAGALSLPLAVLGASKVGRQAWAAALGLGVLLLASLGEATPVFSLLRTVAPLFHAFRYPERMVLLPMLGFTLLIARGFDALLALDGRVRPASWLALPLAAAGLVTLNPGLLGAKPGDALANETIVNAATHVGLVSLAAALVGAGLARSVRRAPLLAGLFAVDLLVASVWMLATWSPPSPSRFLNGEPERVLFSMADISTAAGRFSKNPIDSRAFEDWLSRPNLGAMRGVRSVSGVTSIALSRTRILREAVGVERAALRFQARHVVTAGWRTFERFKPVQALGQGLMLFRHDGPLPAVQCTTRWHAAANAAEAAAHLSEGHVAERVEPGDPNGAEVACALERVDAGSLRLVLAPQKQPVLAVVSESYFPGWGVVPTHARVVPADVAMLGAVVPPDVGTLELTFSPPWLTWTLACSAAGVLLTLAAALHRRTDGGGVPA